MEGSELPRAQALALPGAEHPAHDGPGRAANTEGRLAGERGRGYQGRPPGQRRGQQLSSIRTEWTWNKSTQTWDSFIPLLWKKSNNNNCRALLGEQSCMFTPTYPHLSVEGTKPVSNVWIAGVWSFVVSQFQHNIHTGVSNWACSPLLKLQLHQSTWSVQVHQLVVHRPFVPGED